MTRNPRPRAATRLLLPCMLVLIFTSIASAGWKEKVVYSFQGGTSDGSSPAGGLVFDAAGNLYGNLRETWGTLAQSQSPHPNVEKHDVRMGHPPQSLAAKKFQITSCPFQADVAGATYTLTQQLTGIGQGDCIDVTAPRITIEMNGNGISSIGGDRAAISISKGANGAHIVGGGASIGGRYGFSFGIYDAGDLALIEKVTIFDFGTIGIFLDTVQGSVVNGINVKEQANVGILLQDTNHCVVENSTASQNVGPKIGKAIGIAIRNSSSMDSSKNNVIIHNQADSNGLWGIAVFTTGNLITNNTANDNNSEGEGYGWGIYLGASAGGNFVTDNTASGNELYDADDESPRCGSNHWNSNMFTKVNQKCIH